VVQPRSMWVKAAADGSQSPEGASEEPSEGSD
jgi:hypothetical protein